MRQSQFRQRRAGSNYCLHEGSEVIGFKEITSPIGGAKFSRDMTQRFRLWRHLPGDGPTVIFIGLNPSTANAIEDDPTIRRCIGFAHQWQASRLEMLNLFSFRATDPKDLFAHFDELPTDPWGPCNLWQIRTATSEQECIVVYAWGASGKSMGRQFEKRIADVQQHVVCEEPACLGRTKEGFPRHPLYLPKSAERINYLG